MKSLKITAILLVTFVTYAAAGSGSITVRNSGGYEATFSVAYDLDGHRATEESGKFLIGKNKAIQIPDRATNIYLKVEEYWLPGTLATIFSQSYSHPVTKCFKIWGTTLDPKWDEQNC